MSWKTVVEWMLWMSLENEYCLERSTGLVLTCLVIGLTEPGGIIWLSSNLMLFRKNHAKRQWRITRYRLNIAKKIGYFMVALHWFTADPLSHLPKERTGCLDPTPVGATRPMAMGAAAGKPAWGVPGLRKKAWMSQGRTSLNGTCEMQWSDIQITRTYHTYTTLCCIALH